MIKKISNFHPQTELERIGFDKSYRNIAAKKHQYFSFKFFALTPQQATILKQSAISIGTDCAIHRHVIDCKIKKTDCIISASISQFEKLAKKLERQPFSLKKMADDILELVKIHTQPKETIVMGILNITPDSFSDGGKYLDPKKAMKHADEMIRCGAKIIDIGAESTRPGAKPVDADVEIERTFEIVQSIKKMHPDILISIDTRNSKTASIKGVDIINDVSGMNYDGKILDVAIKQNKQLVITHSRGIPENMDGFANYQNVVEEVYFELKSKCDFAISRGMKSKNIIIDPGFGFAKNTEQNMELLKHISEFKSLGYRVLAGVSRKRFLQKSEDLTNIASFYLALNGIDIIRVHNVDSTIKALNFTQALI